MNNTEATYKELLKPSGDLAAGIVKTDGDILILGVGEKWDRDLQGYQTLDVVRAVCNSGRRNEIVRYTGNDDNIVADLLTTYEFEVTGNWKKKYLLAGYSAIGQYGPERR